MYDLAWGSAALFSSTGADGTVRVFDMRDKDHSAIVYEAQNRAQPLIRLAWNKADPHYIAAVAMDSPVALLLDLRFPSAPVAEISGHTAPANAIAWAPLSSSHLCTAGDDHQALLWDLGDISAPSAGPRACASPPTVAFAADQCINQLKWSSLQPDWVALCYGRTTQILKV